MDQTASPGPAPTAALPVEVDVDGRLRDTLVAHLEGPLGWQVTVGDDLPPVVRLIGVESATPDAGPATRSTPTVLLVRDGDPAHRAARAAAHADAVLAWPAERDRLPDVAAALTSATLPAAADSGILTLGGAAGGVGTTTVALAIAGLVAWHGRRCLAVCTGDVPVGDVREVAPAALTGHRTWEAATPVPGVPGLRALAAPPGPRPAVTVPDGVTVVHDRGVTADGDVLVVARDRAGVQAISATLAGVVVVTDRGAVSMAALRRAATGRRPVVLAWSERVGRAGAMRRVPASLPGRWLSSLAPLAMALR